ncbi:DUF551 domain-containing protein [Citrobacter portucalensis]
MEWIKCSERMPDSDEICSNLAASGLWR